jgi:hypothetical protein
MTGRECSAVIALRVMLRYTRHWEFPLRLDCDPGRVSNNQIGIRPTWLVAHGSSEGANESHVL